MAMKYAELMRAAVGGLLLITGPTAQAQGVGVLKQAYLDCVKQMADANLKNGVGGATGVTEGDKLDCACKIGAGAVKSQLRRKFSDEKLQLATDVCARAYRDNLNR
jgi:hypothetical protein